MVPKICLRKKEFKKVEEESVLKLFIFILEVSMTPAAPGGTAIPGPR